MTRSLLITSLLTFCFTGLVLGDAVAKKPKYDPFLMVKSLKKERKKQGARGAGGPKKIASSSFKFKNGKLQINNKLKKKTFQLPGGGVGKLSDIIKANFGKKSQKGSRGSGSLSSRGLYIEPIIEPDLYETKDAYVISEWTTKVVSNPTKAGMKGHRGARGSRSAKKRVKKGEFKLSKVPNKKRRTFFEKLEKKIKKLPSSHPMRKAYDENGMGMAGYLNAFADGKGEYQRRIEVVIPKKAPEKVGKNGVRFHLLQGAKPKEFWKNGEPIKGGKFDTTAKINWLNNMVKKPRKAKPTKRKKKNDDAFTYKETQGVVSNTHKFLTGWTESWEFRKSVGDDYVIFEYFFEVAIGYSIGFRVPVQIVAKMEPAHIRTYSNVARQKGGKGGDDAQKVTVKLEAKVTGQDENYFKNVGWIDKDEASRGKEFAFHFYAYVKAFVEVCGIDLIDVKPGLDFDRSADLIPVFGKNKTLKIGDAKGDKNAAFWIPGKAFGMHWHVGSDDLWASLEGHVGVQFGGDGRAYATIQPRINYKAVGKAEEKRWDKPGQTKKFEFEVPAAKKFMTKATSYGYTISKPRYEWDMWMKPVVRATIEGECDYFWCGYAGPKTYELGPWAPLGKFEIGTTKLGLHEQTTPKYVVDSGTKLFQKKEGGPREMHVCLKAHTGKYLYASSTDFDLVGVGRPKCDMYSTFKIKGESKEELEKGGNGPIPLSNNLMVSLKSSWGKYLSAQKDHSVEGNRRKVDPRGTSWEKFRLRIHNGNEFKDGAVISLETAHDGARLMATRTIGAAGLFGRPAKKRAKAGGKAWQEMIKGGWHQFTVVETKPKKFTWKCPEGKLSGHSNCTVAKLPSLKSLKRGKLTRLNSGYCDRNGKDCPCYIKKAKGKKYGEVWCVETLEGTGRLAGKKIKNKNFINNYGICGSNPKRTTKGWRHSVRKGKSSIKLTRTLCRAYKGVLLKNTKAVCKPVPLKKTVDFVRFKHTPTPGLAFAQETGACPYWIDSKHKRVFTRAKPKRK